MSKKQFIYFLFPFLTLLLLTNFNLKAQFYFLDEPYDQVEIEFLRQKIETEVDKSFFNALYIKNPSNRTLSFITNFSYPANWTFMGDKSQRISLAPNDSVIIPFRAATSIDAKGEIGYAIVASLNDLKGKPFKTEYSFVNIPKISNYRIRPFNRVEYFDKNTNKANVKLFVANNGNTDEIFYFEYQLDQALESSKSKDKIFKEELELNPYSDTILNLEVLLDKKKNYSNKIFHKIQIKTIVDDSTINRTVWVKDLENKYANNIPDNYKLLSIDLTASNIFTNSTPTYDILVYGNLLFKDKSDLFYSSSYNSSTNFSNKINNLRFLLKYNRKKLELLGGHFSPKTEQNLYGRGASITYKTKKTEFYVASTFNDLTKSYGGGGSALYRFKKVDFGLGYSFLENNKFKLQSNIGDLKIGSNLKKIGNIKFQFGLSQTSKNIQDTTVLGYGGKFSYNNQIKNTSISINSNFGTPNYSGTYRSRIQIIGNINHKLSSTTNLISYYNFNKTSPDQYYNISRSNINNIYEQLQINYSKIVNGQMTIATGIGSDHFLQELNYQGSNYFDFETRNTILNLSTRLRSKEKINSINISLKGAYNFASQYDKFVFDTISINKNWISWILSVNYRSRLWGVFSAYYNGPYNINQQFNYFAYDFYSKNLRIFPYLNITVIPKYLYLTSKINYTYDISGKINRINFINEIIGFPHNTLKVSFLGTLNYQSEKDLLTDEKFTFYSTYFELRLHKDLNFNQPRYQYHDLEVVFFKDINGNLIKEDDEPGIQNVLFSIHLDDEQILDELEDSRNYFMATELLSDMDGKIKYEAIPNGFYIIEYNPMGEIKGAFTSQQSMQKIYIGDDKKIYIPYFESNKIFGKVILNRSKLSNLGKIDISNIKVTAEDSYGKKYSSLTDHAGNFLIYVPSVDKYTVKINNIFFENFELEQNNFHVQLNGYRQFEINFVFNEKKRKINFASSYDYGSRLDGPGVEIVRRTNLAGTIKDATTLKPIIASIRVIDGEGKEITNATSSLKTGIFTTSFVAGDNYSIEVLANDYWFHAENLYSQQIVTFKNLKKDILLKGITVGSLIPMKTLNFEAGSYDIPATSFPELERLMKVLKKNPSVKIAVHGHADDLEILDSETDLALERAKLVAKYLIANGYNRVKYVGHSNTKPIADNDTEDGRRQNRRVEIVVTGK